MFIGQPIIAVAVIMMALLDYCAQRYSDVFRILEKIFRPPFYVKLKYHITSLCLYAKRDFRLE